MKKIFSMPFLLFALIVNAQAPKQNYSFTLQQAIAFALENNYSSINSTRDIEAAKQKKWETTAAGLPQINAGVDYNNYLKQPVTLADFDNNGVNEEFIFGTKQNILASATLSQLIFDGSYIVALHATKTYMNYYENNKQKTDNDVKEMVINSYGNVLLAEESIEILLKNKSALEKTLFDTKETFKNGLIEEENVEQLEITLATINSSLSYNTRLKDIAYKMLKINLGIEINDNLSLTDKLDNLTKENLDYSLSQNEFNIQNNIDYKIGLDFQEQRRLEVQLEKSKALPTLGAFVNYGLSANNNTFSFFNSGQKWYDSSLLGVSLNVPIFSSLARSSRTQQANIAYDKAKTDLIAAEQKIKLAYESAKNQYEYSVEQYTTSKNNLKLAERIEQKQQVKFTEGLSTSFDFNDAQRQLYTAQQNYLQSMVNVISTKAALEKIINNK
ncbi:TolC family protein [Flavobacterium sp. N3904]|uniref:TolC family protein n=1 Tax=Flavobacterium sp. N3904 TaxID=2986835 RepID=UPI0022251D32|nr:TolC family protein [Flavobacterium sp. N3904]